MSDSKPASVFSCRIEASNSLRRVHDRRWYRDVLGDGGCEGECDQEEERDDEGNGVNNGSGDNENWIGIIF